MFARLAKPLASFALLTTAALAQDWPQYAGPHGDRTAEATIGLRQWSEDGPPEAWKVATKAGFSSLAIANGRAFTLVTRKGKETCVALSVKTGKELWARPLGQIKYDGGGGAGARDNRGGDGPRSTPSHDGKHVYVFDAGLTLHCLREANGKPVWKKDLVADYGGRNIRWQSAASALIEGDAVFVAGGGAGESLLAFHKKTGKLLWKAHDERMTHATPIAATIHGVRQVVYFVQSGLLAVAPKTGEALWRAAFPYRVSSAASPVVSGDIVFCSAGYGVGAGAFKVTKTDEGFEASSIWRKRNRLINHWSTPVVKDGHLYGMFSFKKYGTGPLKCVDIATGEVKWSEDGFGPGNCILVGDDVVALSDKGEVVLVEATAEGYNEVARADVLRGKCWSTPTFSDGQLFVRSTVEAARLDLSRKKGN